MVRHKRSVALYLNGDSEPHARYISRSLFFDVSPRKEYLLFIFGTLANTPPCAVWNIDTHRKYETNRSKATDAR